MQFVVTDPSVMDFYEGKNGTGENSGFDLYLPAEQVFPAGGTVMVHLGISATTNDGSGYWLLPRSSIAKTPLRFANSIGLIDPTYRGSLIAAIWNPSDTDVVIKKGIRIAQVALASLRPFQVEWVSTLNETERGHGGFGSTG